MSVEAKIRAQIAAHPVLLYLKGTPQFPQCGFSAQVAHILELCGTQFTYVNILENPDIRATLPKIANWPTFPQLYIQGELVGGCDIATEAYENGELLPRLQAVGAVSEKSKAIPA
jgi:monothiol glutaredoxin